MSGYADYINPDLRDIPRHAVPVVCATKENFKDYGIIYDSTNSNPEIIITPWIVTGKRKLMKGTGVGEGTVSGKFEYWYDGKYLRTKNHAVGGEYFVGIYYEKQYDKSMPQYILTREANYHPDSGQLFVPSDGTPFILLLALPTDDIKLDDFIAFKFDGTKSVQIKPNIWHQPVFPLESRAMFFAKQGSVHACIGVDTINEFGKWLEVSFF